MDQNSTSRLCCMLAAALCLLFCRATLAQGTDGEEHLRFLSSIESAAMDAIDKASKSVVAIARVRRDQNPGVRTGFDPLRIRDPNPSSDPLEDPEFIPKFFGSGIVLSADGFIVTCAHVLDDPREHFYYVWLDKRSYQARVVGKSAKVYAADPFSDLAVLKIEAADLNPIEFGDTNSLRRGKFVICLGNPDAIAMDGQASASWGIISNLKRIAPQAGGTRSSVTKDSIHQYGTLLQLDAKLGRGSSGGAVVDLQGKLIGLSTSLVARAGFENSAGFAIAADEMFRRVVNTLRIGKLPEYGFLGIQPEDIDALDRRRGLHGARVSVVIAGLPGDHAGLRAGDLIVQVNHQPVHNRRDLFRELSMAGAGDEIELTVHRRSGNNARPNRLTLTARLSKKYVASTQPAFAINGPGSWRGMSVEYATAVPSERTRSLFLGQQRDPPRIAVLHVEPDTPAWNAGIRPGYGIVSAGRLEISTPDQFYETVADHRGAIELAIISNDGHQETIVLPAQVGDAPQVD